jgi:hypothetical protein
MAKKTVTPIPIREPSGAYSEPTLDEMLSDSIVGAVMQADGVNPDKLKAMLNRIAGELQARARLAPFVSSAGLTRSFVFIPHGYPGNVPNEPNPQ